MNISGGALKAAYSFGFNHRIVKNGAGVGLFDDTFSNSTGNVQAQKMVFATDTNKIVLQTQEEGSGQEPIIICGCGTTIWGLKPDGSDVFWTALGDDINVLELCDMDGDGRNEVKIVSFPCFINTNPMFSCWLARMGLRSKCSKMLLFGMNLTRDPTMALCSLRVGTFAFGLSSGVVGVYSNGERHWRVKTKSQIVSLLPFPDSDHVVCVWHNGKIDVRGVDSGEIRCKEQIEGDMLGLVFRNGQVHGIEFRKDEGTGDDSQKLMREYGQRKHNLLEELKNYERRESDECGLDLSLERGLCLHLSINNNVPIKAVLLFAEGIFESECYSIHPMERSSLPSCLPIFAQPKILLLSCLSKCSQVSLWKSKCTFLRSTRCCRNLPLFLHVDSLTVEPKGSYLEFKLAQPARPDQLSSWLTENFIFPEDLETIGEKLWDEHGDFIVKFVCTRNSEPLILEILSSGETTIKINDIESAGSILQSLAAHLNVKDLETRAFFPNSLQVVQNAINTMDESMRLMTVCPVTCHKAVRNAADSRKIYLRVAMLNENL
uniref:Uncharacterized protein n=1 Tax=Ditylenchus dipsaci TaxID=166011 RepID=A0A915E3B2_9BILA